jgi:hypothetical protein
MNQNKRWYRWLKQATLGRHKALKHVYSDGRQLLAGGQHSFYARRVALDKRGRVSLDEAEAFVVDEGVERFPPFANALPGQEPAVSVVVDRERLLRALRGQEQQVRLSVYAVNLGIVELRSDGAYALLLATGNVEDGTFWRPELDEAAPNGADGAKTSTLTETSKEG